MNNFLDFGQKKSDYYKVFFMHILMTYQYNIVLHPSQRILKMVLIASSFFYYTIIKFRFKEISF